VKTQERAQLNPFHYCGIENGPSRRWITSFTVGKANNRVTENYNYSKFSFFLFFFFFLVVLRLELRAYTLSHSTSPFIVMDFFEIGSCELFARAGFKSWSSWSLPPEYLGLQVWVTGAQLVANFLMTGPDLLGWLSVQAGGSLRQEPCNMKVHRKETSWHQPGTLSSLWSTGLCSISHCWVLPALPVPTQYHGLASGAVSS
jgi:hypothetical protein